MHIKRLRLQGFKSFVEPTDLAVEQGLTGVVGPNGCGKSNLLEAIRWVMGESSHKSMRASAMDDVIFAGTNSRPARNHAEVSILLDNSARTAPAEFNGADQIEVVRRIERESGSSYRVNGEEARARDIKLLFEDAATGARSPALVRQGQIAELVNAKPEQRRRILEDAAGTAGLASRRHEAELRFKAAETNLARLGDVLGQITSQIAQLKRQARAAKRYKELAGEIRAAEAIERHLAFESARLGVEAEEAALLAVLQLLGSAIETESKEIREEAATADALPGLRETEVTRAAILQRLRSEAATLEREEARTRERKAELDARIQEVRKDEAREAAQAEEARALVARLFEEAKHLAAAAAGDGEAASIAERDAARARADLEAAEAELELVTLALADHKANRRRLESLIAEEARRLDRLEQDAKAAQTALASLSGAAGRPDSEAMRHRVEEIEAAIETLEADAEEHETRSQQLARTLEQKRTASSAARLAAARITAEAGTLRKLFARPAGSTGSGIIDRLKVAPGYEAALGAALGEDLDAPEDSDAPLHWALVEPEQSDPALPEGIESLAGRVKDCNVLRRRLLQVGLVDATEGKALQARLRPGQLLVSRAGDLWRWDGYTAAADAPSAAAVRLAERNRLDTLETDETEASDQADAAEQALAVAAETRDRAIAREKELRALLRRDQSALQEAREALARAERILRDEAAKRAALSDSLRRAETGLAESRTRHRQLADEIASAPDMSAFDAEQDARRQSASKLRTVLAEADARLKSLERERRQRDERGRTIADERARWTARCEAAGRQLSQLAERLVEARTETETLAELPLRLAGQRNRLGDAIGEAETVRQQAADTLALAEIALRDRQSRLREVQTILAGTREERARVEVRLEAARARRAEEARRIREALDCDPAGCLKLAGLTEGAQLPQPAEVAKRLARLREDRERLGGVNLAAEQELQTLEAQHESMDRERADLEAAIDRLRQGIQKLNREGRKRLEIAFRNVNTHFERLFTTLFGGGEARLEMIDNPDDPLAGGLEIIAKPPGKKPATLSLLSGGEQTLTALSLIFAVFLTNPSPICVLDEVDAPLDDSNVDRFCTLMEEMARTTDTRFLVITHHPMTMSRMHRLFGVTMQEKGISQLVSVDLATAERFREAG